MAQSLVHEAIIDAVVRFKQLEADHQAGDHLETIRHDQCLFIAEVLTMTSREQMGVVLDELAKLPIYHVREPLGPSR